MTDYVNETKSFIKSLGCEGGDNKGDTGPNIENAWGCAMGSYCPAAEPDLYTIVQNENIDLQTMIIIGITVIIAILLCIILVLS